MHSKGFLKGRFQKLGEKLEKREGKMNSLSRRRVTEGAREIRFRESGLSAGLVISRFWMFGCKDIAKERVCVRWPLERRGPEEELLRGQGAPREWKAVSPFAEKKRHAKE